MMAPGGLPSIVQLLYATQLLIHPTLQSTHAGPAPRDTVNLQDRQTNVFTTLGAGSQSNGTTHPRLEIRQLEKNADQWNLFLLAMRKFQERDQRDKLSYYQIAGIHGRPYTSWDSVGRGPGSSSGGYCAHGSNVFPTWHRPYLALFEELLLINAKDVIAEFGDGDAKDRYNAVLPTLRLPYWDWAAVPLDDQPSMPASVRRPRIDVDTPQGGRTIDNPLYQYRFHSLNTDDFPDSPFNNYRTTVRDPSSRTDPNAASRNDLIVVALDRDRTNLQSRVFNILAMQDDYTTISSDQQRGDSLENIHDTIHNVVGSGGHMSELGYAGYDPLFWLHHANVDRILAIWQKLNPDSWVERGQDPYATFTTPQGSTVDRGSSLRPFRKDDHGAFWNSDDVRSTELFGYTYPELVGLNDSDTSALTDKVNALYGPDATHQEEGSSSKIRRNEHHIPGNGTITGAAYFSGKRQYVANIKVRKHSLDGSFSVYIFIGDEPDDDVTFWPKQPSFVGTAGILSHPGNANTEKGKVNANAVVPLTAALEERVRDGKLENMNETIVAKYLKDNLKWRIVKTRGEEVAVQNTPGFQVRVLWSEVKPAKSHFEFPKMTGDFKILANATEGRPGGFKNGDQV